MPSCPTGAVVKPGEPVWYVVTAADLDNWYGSWGLARWFYSMFEGRAYKLQDLADQNPDLPGALTLGDILLGAAVGGRYGPQYAESAWAERQIAYRVFSEHCLCNAAPVMNCIYEYPDAKTWTSNTIAAISYTFGIRFTVLKSGTITGVRLWDSPTAPLEIRNVYCWDWATGTLHQSHATPTGVGRQEVAFTTPVPVTAGTDWVVGYGCSNGHYRLFDAPEAGWSGSSHAAYVAAYYANGFPTFPTIASGVTWAIEPKICAVDTLSVPPAAAVAENTSGYQTIAAPSGTTNDQLAERLEGLAMNLNSLRAGLIAIQQNLVPFVYLLSTAHAGLTGHGVITGLVIIGVKIVLTGLPSGYRSVGAEVPSIFDLGWLTFGTVDGWEESRRIDHSAQLLFTPNASIDRLAYDLPPGVTATITELIAGAP